MQSFFRAVLFLPLLGLAVGCTTIASMDHKGPDAGYLVASMALPQDNQYFTNACLDYQPKAGGPIGSMCFAVRPGLLVPEAQRDHEITKFEEGDFRGGVRVRALAPGEYVLVGHTVSDANRAIKGKMAVPFTIRPGATTYVGSYQFTFTWGESIWGQKMVRGTKVGVADRMARDVEKAAALRGVPKNAQKALPSG